MQFRKSILFLSLIGLMALSSSAFAQQQSGDFYYTVSGNTVTIIGYTGSGGIVVIPATLDNMPVVAIGDLAFQYRTNLISVTIPDSVMSIGLAAFWYCDLLNSVTIGKGVISIGSYAFWCCANLTKAYFLGNAPSMGTEVFYCSGVPLQNLTICYTAGSTGFKNPWCFLDSLQERYCYPARVCGASTTTTVPARPCAAEAIYGRDSEETELLREYRDNVLSKSATGRQMINTYYKLSPAVADVLQKNDTAKANARRVLDSLMPAIKERIEH